MDSSYDLIIGDETIVHPLRIKKVTTPIIVLSDSDSTETKLKAFRQGADDFVSRPFHVDELKARINAIVRRSQGRSHDLIVEGDLTIDLTTGDVFVRGEKIHLTIKEFQLLAALARRKGVTMTKEQLIDRLYGDHDAPELRIIDVFVCKIRAKLQFDCIKTIWAKGYSFDIS
jgi:two-component system cell cycle response regulator CtrA